MTEWRVRRQTGIIMAVISGQIKALTSGLMKDVIFCLVKAVNSGLMKVVIYGLMKAVNAGLMKAVNLWSDESYILPVVSNTNRQICREAVRTAVES